MDKTLLVTCAVIRKDEKILIAKRKKDTLLEPGRWEFPGGKVEHGEHPEQAIKREIKEELGIDIKVRQLLDIVSHVWKKEHGNYHIILLGYLAEIEQGSVQHIDCQDTAWITPEQIETYDFLEPNKKFIKKI